MRGKLRRIARLTITGGFAIAALALGLATMTSTPAIVLDTIVGFSFVLISPWIIVSALTTYRAIKDSAKPPDHLPPEWR